MCLISFHQVGRISKMTRLLNGQEKGVKAQFGRSKKCASYDDAVDQEQALPKSNNY